ncbi:MAG TPA: MBL fold metallo-hydrolase [Mucilaginibacter sp.]|jgi:phosphoribosyl 1,2-cyclic phosphodiesterase|nr:MBL fold metallo-hydrolase [Mucilaginibacter sp.]
MALFIASLNSGSNGNCYYVGNDRDAVLIDAGISCRETERRMLRLGLSMKKVRAIFVSHEHSDHINGITVLSKKYDLPVYITPATLQNSGLSLAHHLSISFAAFQPVMIGEIAVSAFPKFHDAAHAHSFILEYRGIKVGVLTDIGAACENVRKHFKQCHAAFLEANYDEEMLEKGRYPYHLKRRIHGGLGHLSNTQALEIFINHRSPSLSHLLLAHLSRDNNSPELVKELFDQHANGTEIIVASRYQESAVYHITGVPLAEQKPITVQSGQMQYSLF